MVSPGWSAVRVLMVLWLTGVVAACAHLRLPLMPIKLVLVDQSPVTFKGEVSCPGCNERWLTLTLFPDKTYRLLERFSAPTAQDFYDLGSWQLQGQRLLLRGGVGQSRQLAVDSADSLKLLDHRGKALRSIRRYELVRQKQTDLLSGPMRLTGLYAMTAQGGRLHECLTGKVMTVSPQGFGSELARQYAEQQRALSLPLATPILVTVTAQFTAPTKEKQEQINVHLLDRFWPSRVCPAAGLMPAQPLLLTRWLLIELNGQSLDPARVDKPAHMRLLGNGRMQGHTGCNTVQGRYQQQAANLSFSQLATTRMACHGAVAIHEQQWLKALTDSGQFEMRGNQLLLIQGTNVLARFRADEMY